MRRTVSLLALIGAPALAAGIPAGSFTIDGQRFAPDTIVDARALPSLDGHATILVTLSPAAAKRLATITRAKLGKPVPIALDGKTLMTPVVREPVVAGTIEIDGGLSLPDAEATARRISGKDPVPEEFDE